MSGPQAGFDFGDAGNRMIARRRFAIDGGRNVLTACNRSADTRVSSANILSRSEGFDRAGLGKANRFTGGPLFTRFRSGSGIAARNAGNYVWRPKRRIGITLILITQIARLNIYRRRG